MTLATGGVVFIDDEIDDEHSSAAALLADIRSTGRPVAALKDVPPPDMDYLEHWRSIAFLVIDWDLAHGSLGSVGSATLSEFKRQALFAFLREILENIFCPIFIISAEDVDDIKSQLAASDALRSSIGRLESRLKVFPKSTLMTNIVDHLDGWIATSPALTIMRVWDQEHTLAKHQFFLDLNALEPDWPVYVWRAAEAEGADPSYELSSTVATNIQGRMRAVAFDGDVITAYDGELSSESRIRISQGRTFVPASQLPVNMAAPGDLFQFQDDPDNDEIWMNVSPVCQTVVRPNEAPEQANSVQLHLIRGERLPRPATPGAFNDLKSKGNGPNSIVIHTLIDGHPYRFHFGSARIERWLAIQPNRLGRVLPPFSTRVQQKHAAYMQSEGLPPVTHELYLP